MSTKTFPAGTEFAAILRRLVTVLCLCAIVLCSACAPSVYKLEEQGDVAGLLAILTDPSASVDRRNSAANALGNLGSPLAVEALIQAMQASYEQEVAGTPVSVSVSTTAHALGKIGDPRAVDPLIAILEHENAERSPYGAYVNSRATIEAVVGALGELGDPRAAVPILRGLNPRCRTERGTSQCLNWDAFQALGEPAIERVIEALPGLRDQDRPTYLHALAVLAGETDPRIRAVLEAAFRAPSDQYNCKEHEMEALGEFLGYDADQLLPYLESEDTICMYRLLIKIGKPGTEAALITALDKYGDEQMADDYILCGNKPITSAGMHWYSERGYTASVSAPTSPFGSADPCGWGVGP